jgi:DNA helicase-2/ATP-dependent DNA helicase PcrA
MDKVHLFNNLNEKQIEAVKYTEGYVRVVAGAGSGKTRLLANRYAYIVEYLGINPSNILCVTFTNRASREMKIRIKKLLSTVPVNDFICTYHSFCVRVLREDINKINYPKNFSIADTEDQKSILKEVYENLDLTSTNLTYKRALKVIGELKNKYPYIEKLIIPNEMKQFRDKDKLTLEEKIFMEFIRLQKKYFALDFQDLIFFTDFIFKSYKNIRLKWSNKFHYIMVDETQDNSFMQWCLLEYVSGTHRNVFVVGDPDQSIYEWRYAIPDHLVNLEKFYNPLKSFILDQNYRSTNQILKVANNLITKNKNRIEKDMYTTQPLTSKIVYYHAKSDQEESKWVVQKIIELKDKGYGHEDIAILYRANYISRIFEQTLIEFKIPYVVYGGIRFFERREIKDALSYLKVIAQNDDLSFLRVINTPKRGLGKVFINKVKGFAEDDGCTLYEATKNHISELNKLSAAEFIKTIEKHKAMVDSTSISDILQSIMEKTGFLKSIRLDGEDERIENINELFQSIKYYEEDNSNEEDVTLINYLQDIALYTNIDYKKDKNYVKLMTIHQAKGLEFKVVFVVGMSEGVIPNHRSLRERKIKALEEERRLAYVAITRAERVLFLTESEGYSNQTGTKYPSRFLFEIKKDLLHYEGEMDNEIISQAKAMISQFDVQNNTNNDIQVFEIRDMVYHPVFGKGEIVDIDTENNPHYDIKFEKLDTVKPIRLDFPNLKKQADDQKAQAIGTKPKEITNNLENLQISTQRNNQYTLKCPNCENRFIIDTKDLPNKDQKKRLRCDKCGQNLSVSIPDSCYTCEHCSKIFESLAKKQEHLKDCIGYKKYYTCKHCKTDFYLNEAERNHLENAGGIIIKCPNCSGKNKITLENV